MKTLYIFPGVPLANIICHPHVHNGCIKYKLLNPYICSHEIAPEITIMCAASSKYNKIQVTDTNLDVCLTPVYGVECLGFYYN